MYAVMPRSRRSLAACCLILGASSSRTTSASCEREGTFLDKAEWPCTTVLAVVVERTGFEYSPGSDGFYGATVRVTRVLRGDYPDRLLTIWGGGGMAGPPPTAKSLPVGSTWAVVLRPIETGNPGVRYSFGGQECEGGVAIPLGPDDPSGRSLHEQLDRATSDSVPRWRSECLSGTSDSCYALACAQEQGLGVRRDLSSALALYRRAYEIRAGIMEE
jgi:hypothetical protein